MLSVSQAIPILDTLTGFTRGDKAFMAERLIKVSTLEQESTDMTFFTDEGDRVTISSESKISSEYVDYRRLLVKKDTSAILIQEDILINSESESSMIIEGDLSEEELRDIKKAIMIVDKIMQDLKSGDIENAMALANKALRLDSISGFIASSELEKRVTLKEHFQASNCNTSPENFNNGYGDMNVQDQVKSLSDRIMEIINNSGVDISKIIKPFKGYFSQLIQDNSHHNSEGKDRDDIFKMTSLRLLDRIKDIHEKSVNRKSGHKEA